MVLKNYVMLVIALLLLPGVSYGIESPTSVGPASLIDTPIFRVPKTSNPPTIDGVVEEGEWEDASALSSFWYDWAQSDFRFLAPIETQLQVYGMYDDTHLYIAYVSPVYPEGSWLKARGRFPNVVHHPMYGILWDDHIEFELRPYHDMARGFQLGLFKWIPNPIDALADYFWSPRTGDNFGWSSQARIRSNVTRSHWTIEMAIPFESLAHSNYSGYDATNTKIVQIPPPDGTAYRCWFVRGIGGLGTFFNAFDAHSWNTTKTKMIFDSRAVAFQINELGPIMEDILDLQITVKNHNTRSETMRLGFFVENNDGLIYSSYEDDQLTDGLLELIPGEVRRLRLRQAFPGVTMTGNTLWFDVRTAGAPAKPVFQTRLVNFHSQDLPATETMKSFRERRIDAIALLRPPRTEFVIYDTVCPYNNLVTAIVDRGNYGATEESKTAVEARVAIVVEETGEEVASNAGIFDGDFAIVNVDVPTTLKRNELVYLSVLLFDENQRIVGEERTKEFSVVPQMMFETEASREHGWHRTPLDQWWETKIGLDDTVWEPYTPLEVTEDGFEGLKHRFTIDATGLPAQIFIKPHERSVPLELRGEATPSDDDLVAVGRGPQLRSPVRLEAVVDGQRHTAQAIQPARLVRQWQSELEYHSKVRIGPLEADLQVRYDCDGSIHAKLVYGSNARQIVNSFEMITDFRGRIDLVAAGIRGGGGMAGADVWECALPDYEGIVWDSGALEPLPLYYSHFVPWVFFGSGDKGFSWYSDSDREWGLDKHNSSMKLERNAEGEITWRVIFVNHPFNIEGRRTIDFSILTHPAKPKPNNYRKIAWHYKGQTYAWGYQVEQADLSRQYLMDQWRFASRAPQDVKYENLTTWRKDDPPWNRFGRWRNIGIAPAMDRLFEERGAALLGRQIETGRRQGWWWDESWPIGFGTSNNIAAGHAHMRRPETISENELPWQAGFLTSHQRNLQKRLARIFKENNVPQRQFHWANAQANLYESLGWDIQLVEGAGSAIGSFELDIVAQYPMSLYRFMTHPFTGLIGHIVPQTGDANMSYSNPGDDKRIERQYFGLALLHDIGVSSSGPHGAIILVEDALRVMNILDEFGYFLEDGQIEFLPYWRNQQYIRWGAGRQRHAPRVDLNIHEPGEQLYVSIYRRPIEIDGRRGYKALIVMFNGFREDVTADLTVINTQRIFGGPNVLTKEEVLSKYNQAFPAIAERLKLPQGGNTPVLLDLENNSFVELTSTDGGETYGSAYVPYHNYRILYGHFLAE